MIAKGATMGATMHSYKEYTNATAPFHSSFFELLHKEQWREVRLGEVAEIKIGKGNVQDSVNDGIYPFFDRSQKIKKSHKFILDSEAIIVAGEGKDFIPRYYKGRFDLHQRYYAIFNVTQNAKYIYYAIYNQKDVFKSIAVGSTVMSLRLNHFTDFTIPLPPLETQHKIAEILSSLDDKIDLLHRQNKTLESLSLTLFRHTFIDNPNRNKWEEKPLSEIADFLNGLACQKIPPKNEVDRLPVLKIKELREGITESSDWATSEVDSKYIVQNGDIIFSWSASLMVKIWNGQKCILNQHLFKITSAIYPKWFYYFWCLWHLQEFVSIASAQATTMGHIKRQDLDNAICAIPPKDFLDSMDKQISPIFDKIYNNSKQIQNLESLRDIMLPKLLSGEMEV